MDPNFPLSIATTYILKDMHYSKKITILHRIYPSERKKIINQNFVFVKKKKGGGGLKRTIYPSEFAKIALTPF